MTIEVVLVDDHPILREGLRSKFAACDDIIVVGEAGSCEELPAMLSALKPHVVLMDIKLPDGSGLAHIPRLKQLHPCKVIVLTMYDHVRYVVHALESGADGYVIKGASFQELEQAVRQVYSGQNHVSPALAPKLAAHLKDGKAGNPLSTLSNREFDVLMGLCRGETIKDMASAMGISEKTVSTYRFRLLEKLHVDSNAALIRYAVEANLID